MNFHRYTKLILALSSVIGILSIIELNILGWNEESIRILIRWSAKISATLFCIAFGVSSFQYLFDDRYSVKFLQHRSEIGLSFGVFHSAHLVFLILLQQYFHPVFDLANVSSLVGGGLAYVFMYAMMITTYPSVRSRLSVAAWKILHTIGAYWIWIIFFRSYLKNVINKNQEYFLFSLLLLVMILRISYMVKRKRST